MWKTAAAAVTLAIFSVAPLVQAQTPRPPAMAPGGQAAAAPSAGPINPLAARAGAIAPPSGGAETQGAFMARCRREVLARYPGSKGVDAGCTETWGRANAALPAVDAILAVAPAQPGPVDTAALKARLASVKWGTRLGKGELAAGKLGKWDVTATGKGPAEGLKFSWAAVGDFSPFDVFEGLKVRGATLTEVGCLGFGAEEQTHVYRAAAAGKPPFGLTIYNRQAPTASASSFYSAILDFKNPVPTLASLKRTPEGADYAAKCE